ncbi:hypothetical protein AMECASPLE_027404 [Ameca splendens]|uniref:Secreted protein n=1 Tax=Ameca splendens TaxID=208324 RepID=A0ABV0XU23_9TELE
MFPLIACLPVLLGHTPLPSAYKLSGFCCSLLVPYVDNPCCIPEFLLMVCLSPDCKPGLLSSDLDLYQQRKTNCL